MPARLRRSSRRKHHGAGALRLEIVDDLLHGDDGRARGEHRFLLDTDDAADKDVTATVRLLRVDHRDIGFQRRHCGEPFTGEGTGDELNAWIRLNEVGAEIPAEDRARHARRASCVGEGHCGVAMCFDVERMRPPMFDRIPEAMQGADSGISAPGKHQFPGAAAADHLIVEKVRCHPDQRQAGELLPDDFVACGEWNEVRETFQRDRRAGGDQPGDGCRQT